MKLVVIPKSSFVATTVVGLPIRKVHIFKNKLTNIKLAFSRVGEKHLTCIFGALTLSFLLFMQ